MSSNLDDKLASALAIAIAHRPRANLQQIAKSAGISKATLYRIAPTREGLIEMLLERAASHLNDALAKAELDKPPFADALRRLTEKAMQGRGFYLFWHSAQWVQMVDANAEIDSCTLPSVYGDALEKFFLKGQKAGVFRIDMPAIWLVKSYEYLLLAAVDSAQRGEVATVGMATLVDNMFLTGAIELPADKSNAVDVQTPSDA